MIEYDRDTSFNFTDLSSAGYHFVKNCLSQNNHEELDFANKYPFSLRDCVHKLRCCCGWYMDEAKTEIYKTLNNS